MRFSIRDKILFSYILLVSIAFMIMIFFINNSIIKNNENMILGDLEKIEGSVNTYAHQFMLLNNVPKARSEFSIINMDLLKDLNEKINARGVMYYYNGTIASDIYDIDKAWNNTDDLELALNKQSAVTIHADRERTMAMFSVPIMVEDTLMGVYRFSKDYSVIYQYGNSLIKSISIFAIFIVFGIIVISLLISYNILTPLLKLRDYSMVVAKGEFDVNVDIKSKDEIGELAGQFVKMKNQIHSQIEAITSKHEKLKSIESYRKQFFDNVTHEFKTPLTIISGYAQVIEDSDFLDRDIIIKGIKYIRKESQRLHDMVLKLLSVSRQTTDKTNVIFEKISISDLLISVCESMNIKAKSKDIKIRIEIDEEMFVCGDKENLRSVFTNVIDNAIKYSPSRTFIEVIAFREEECVKISIDDCGTGIPEDLKDRIFEPFFRVEYDKEKTVEGCGLGLFIAKQVVESHNGTIFVNSSLQYGTCVQISIPIKN
ncbi:UNVERIFIED_CONTAM: signal transduction histidine kinase [Acetivibrio alkalicellulosi]